MKVLKHILVVVALLATVLPCVHATTHDSHHLDGGVELCAIAAEPCACHSNDQHPCADNVEIQLDRIPDTTTIEPPSIPSLLYILPETKPTLIKATPRLSGVLATLQTVQLLI